MKNRKTDQPIDGKPFDFAHGKPGRLGKIGKVGFENERKNDLENRK